MNQPMENFALKTLKKNRTTYPDYILNDHRTTEQKLILVKLNELNTFYSNKGIIDCMHSEPNTSFASVSTVDWNFEVYKIKKAILANRKHTFSWKIPFINTKFANQVFLLAMAHSRKDIVEYFLKLRNINVNQSMFGSIVWPSYFIFACTCSNEILDLFKNYKIKYNIGWNALTPHIIASYKQFLLPKQSYLDFIPYRIYQFLHKYSGTIINSSECQIPIFPLDFACMNKDRVLIKTILEEVPESGKLSRLSFIVQKEENLCLILSKFEFRTDQNFNGETPLHLSCHCDDLCSLSILCNLGFEIRQNNHEKWPHEVGSARTKEKATVFFNLCAYNYENNSKVPKKIFNQSNFNDKMVQWLEILKFNPKDHAKYIGLFRYIEFNKNNKILTNSRFNIISTLTLSKTPAMVESYLKNLSKVTEFDEKILTRNNALSKYSRLYL